MNNTDNELKFLNCKIDYHRNRSQLELENSIKQVNDRINKLVDEINNLREELNAIRLR